MSEIPYDKTVIFKVTKYQRALLELAMARSGKSLADFMRSLLDAVLDPMSVEAHNAAMAKMPETGYVDPIAAALLEIETLTKSAQIESLKREVARLESAR